MLTYQGASVRDLLQRGEKLQQQIWEAYLERVVFHPVYPHMPTRGEFTTGKSMSSPHSWALAHASQSQPPSS
jgi:hypothetical protein